MISVILNVYNGEKFIKRCLDSIINQTFKNIEIIIVNDKSTDNTLSIIKKYKDKRIKIINNKNNLGLSLSRNIGIDNSTKDLLYFVDVDDYLEKDALEYLYNLYKKYKSDITTCRCIDVYKDDVEIKNEKENIEVLEPYEMLKRTLLIKYREGTTWNKLIKRKLFDKVRFEPRIINDVVTTYKLVLESNKIVYSNQIKYNYYRHPGSIISKKRTKYMIDLYKGATERYNYIKNIYPDMLENDATLALLIANIYFTNDKELLDYLNDNKVINKYKKLFSFKLFKCDMRFNDKMKLLLFRINPKLYKFITLKYLKIHKKI